MTLDHFSRKTFFFDKNVRGKNLAQKDIKKCSRIILVMTLQHACSGSLSHLKLQSSSALYRHKWARSQLILNHRILFTSGISTKQTDLIQCHLLRSPRFSKLGRKSGWTPLKMSKYFPKLKYSRFSHQSSFSPLIELYTV